MGTGSWDSGAWKHYSAAHVDTKATVKDIFVATGIDPSLDPKGVNIRESCDSADNPKSTPLIVGVDVTGSMGMISEAIARTGLKTLAESVYDRKPISDPHIMFMGIGDAEYDMAPLQVTQFEADIRIAEQLTKIWLEGHGGGNHYESYALAWYFAAMHTRIDSFEKRGKKGYLFTIGDEDPTPYLLAKDMEKVLGYKPQQDKISAEDILAMVSRQYEVFHLIVEEGSHCRFHGADAVLKKWQNLLGQRAIPLADHTKVGEVIVSTLQVVEGASKDDVAASWDGSTNVVVAKAIASLSKTEKASEGLVKF